MTWTSAQFQARNRAQQKQSGKSKALKAADAEFSLLMRAKEADEQGAVKCCTCGKWMPWKGTSDAQWGHYESRGFNNTRFHPQNGGVQCKKCNCFLEGMKQRMKTYLEKRYGFESVERISALSRIRRQFSETELSFIAKEFRREREALVKVSGI